MPGDRTITACRLCGAQRLEVVIDLGAQHLTGVFPKLGAAHPRRAPLRLVRCADGCGLVQLADTCNLEEMYGATYGYRSGLNPSMVRHLRAKIARIGGMGVLRPGDAVIDIGSNDGTSLAAYAQGVYDLIGIDPSGRKFAQHYPPGARLVPEFFTGETARAALGGRKARVVTSFSMFYDLEDPLGFMREVRSVLADDGIWVFEQSYLPMMLAANSLDTICHEHLEYYGMRQIAWAAERAGLELVEVDYNDVNGGSCSVTARPVQGGQPAHGPTVRAALAEEAAAGLDGAAPYHAFAARSSGARRALLDFLEGARARGERVAALGASTKGNVLLQYAGITPDLVQVVGEVNPDKFGAMTPGSAIPIRPEAEVLAGGYDHHLVLPWHFRDFFLSRPHLRGHRLVFPLPQLEVLVGRGA